MKILQVNILYGSRSTGKIVADMHKALLEKGIHSAVCYGTGKKENSPNIVKVAYHYELSLYRVWSHIMGLQYASGYFSTLRILRYIKKHSPDIVHLQCINGFFVHIYWLLNYLKKRKIKTVITLHAEFMYTGSCGHAFDCERWKTGCGNCPQLWKATYSYFFDRTATAWRKMQKAFAGFEGMTVTAVSSWLSNRASQSPILAGKKIVTVGNGVDTEIFKLSSTLRLREKYGLSNMKILLHVTAHFSNDIDDLKGGRYLLELAQKLENQDVKILLVGAEKNVGNLPNNILNLGIVNSQTELAEFYSLADLTVLTSKRETFSMPLAESLCCGTPVVGFYAGGPESVCIPEFCDFVEYADVEALYKSVLGLLHMKEALQSQGVDISSIARNKYSRERMCKGYIEQYNQLIESSNIEASQS